MYKIINIPIILALLIQLCKGQTNTSHSNVLMNDTINQLIDPIEKIPFNIEQESNYINLPDSFEGAKTYGFCAFELYINSCAKIDSFKIMKFVLKKDDEITFEFFNKNGILSYPKEVQKYHSFLADYLRKKIKINQVPNSIPRNVTIMNLLLRFKSPGLP